jgi:hypothetical protein
LSTVQLMSTPDGPIAFLRSPAEVAAAQKGQ